MWREKHPAVAPVEYDRLALRRLGAVSGIWWWSVRAPGIADTMPRSADGDENVPKEWLIDAAAQFAVATSGETVSRQ
jgi:hypothetical protein